MIQTILKLLVKFITGKFAEKLALILLEKLVERSDNQIDDEILAAVKQALKEKEE